MSTTRVMVLGVVRKRPVHGYEVRATLESWGAEWWAGVSYGSIYFALKKLAAEGLLAVKSTEQAGSRPERTVYAITPEGETEYQNLLRGLWWAYEPTRTPFSVAVTFMDDLPRDEIVAALRARRSGLDHALASYPYVVEQKRALGGEAAGLATSLGHALARAEREWVDGAIERLDATPRKRRVRTSRPSKR